MRVDNIICSVGRAFDIKYYSKYLLKNTAGSWLAKTTSDDDTIVLDDDEIQIYILECLIAAAQQVEGSDAAFDINWAKIELNELYYRYKGYNPTDAKKKVSAYGSLPARGRW